MSLPRVQGGGDCRQAPSVSAHPVRFVAMNPSRLTTLLLGIWLVLAQVARAQESTGSASIGARQVQAASGEAEAAIRQFRVPAGFKVELFAAEPQVANISSFDIDATGKAYVVEVFRRRGGGVLG